MNELTDEKIEAFNLTILGFRACLKGDTGLGHIDRLDQAMKMLREVTRTFLAHPDRKPEEVPLGEITATLSLSVKGRLVEMGYDESDVDRLLYETPGVWMSEPMSRLAIQPDKFVREELAEHGLHLPASV